MLHLQVVPESQVSIDQSDRNTTPHLLTKQSAVQVKVLLFSFNLEQKFFIEFRENSCFCYSLQFKIT